MTPEILLLRQAHPNFVHDGQITSEVFVPFPKDEGLLSVYNGDQVSAKAAYEHYTQILGHASDSVWAVSKLEADQESVPAREDPLEDFEAHAVLDFTEVKSKEKRRKVAKRLKIFALERGCQYRTS